MKILVVDQHFYPEQFRINDICVELVKKGHDVTVLTGLPNYPKGKLYKGFRFFRKRKENYKGVKIKRTTIICRGKSVLRMGINYVSFAVNASIKAFFMKKDFDIVYVYQTSPVSMAFPAIVVAKMKKIPLVIHILDQWPISIASGGFSKTSLFYKWMYRLSRNTYRKADVLSISSRKFEKYIKEELKINDIPIIYNPSYAEDTYKDTKVVDNKKFDLLFAGNIGPATCVETIIEAANLLKDKNDIMFHIVGDGLTKDNCARRAIEYGLDNVKFYGYCSVDEVKKYYDIADGFLITMDDNEVVNNTLPAKLQSYMVAAKPIFGAVSGEAKETIIDSKCGLVVSSKDYEGLAEIIRDNYKKDLSKYGKSALKYYEDHFEKEKCLDDMLKMFNRCIKEKKHGK